ncbi:DUF2271 domain-containing protein [Photobacterium sanctipauli]|uniref:DUF2271 domain-containing protein n=1 Tax=Photobacterium sanctipauli TaxID=1342794 RepID=A0A2T3NNU0_9GAMM|nr:DUF2271 domain-containing protein [Photobacterium sanctipauli]PSW17638.1 DUF2271 domain-containing protein [Photobacterium sanctipauli]
MKVFIPLILAAATAIFPVSANPLPEQANMQIKLELPELDVPMYARPYVAIWLEDSDRQVVRNIVLWTGNHTEWLKDIRSWWRKFGRYNSENIDGISSATRGSGQYRINWDGLDDNGERVQQGNYTLFTEVVREHGGRDLVRKAIVLGEEGFQITTEPKAEIGAIELNYQVN